MRQKSSASMRLRTASPTSSPMTSGKGHTSSRRSWTADMWNWVKSGWNSRVRHSHHDREHLQSPDKCADPGNRADVAAQHRGAKRRLAKEPQDLRLSGCGVARDRGGAVQLVWQEDARTTGQYEVAATAANFAGQHREQRAGVEEPA